MASRSDTVPVVYDSPYKALGMCLISATTFSERNGWGLIRVTGRTYPKREHWASIEVNDDLTNMQVVDATMRQFDQDAPVVFRGTDAEWLDLMCEYLVDGLDYEIHLTHDTQSEPHYTDCWSRDEIEPGEMSRPWARSQHEAQ